MKNILSKLKKNNNQKVIIYNIQRDFKVFQGKDN